MREFKINCNEVLKNMKKYLISMSVILSLFMCSLCLAQAQEFTAPGVDGPILSKEKNTNVDTSVQIMNTEKVALDDEQVRLAQIAQLAQLQAQLEAQLAALRAGETMVSNTVSYDVDIASGINDKGVAYGLARLAQNLAVKRGETTFVSATKVGQNSYNVVLQSVDDWANGTFRVDIFSPNENTLKEGYQIWFSVYDINGKKIASAQAKRI